MIRFLFCAQPLKTAVPRIGASTSHQLKAAFSSSCRLFDKKINAADLFTMQSANTRRQPEGNDDIKTGTGINKEKESNEHQKQKEEENTERLNASANKKYNQRLTKNIRNTIIGSLLLLSSTAIILGTPSSPEDVLPDESFVGGYTRRTMESIKKWSEKSVEPIYGQKLLPDPLPAPYARLATLVVELNDSLVHLVWDKGTGWRVAVRPGAKEFLSYLSRYYEIVLFANTPSHLAQPVADTLDPYNMAMYKLYRESTRIVDGKYVKDLDTLNRDIGKVVCVDVDKDGYMLQPQNGLHLKQWTGEKGDFDLKRMMSLLEEIAIMMQLAQLQDIRPLLRIVNSNNPDDPYQGWIDHKNKMKQEFANKVQPKKTGFASLMRRNQQPETQQTLFDYVEKIALEERAVHDKQMKQEMKQMQKMREEGEKKMIEEMKAKNFKMWDYLFGTANVEIANAQKE